MGEWGRGQKIWPRSYCQQWPSQDSNTSLQIPSPTFLWLHHRWALLRNSLADVASSLSEHLPVDVRVLQQPKDGGTIIVSHFTDEKN